MIEILIAVTFVAICSAAIIEAVWVSNAQSSYAMRRARILGVLQDRLEAQRALAVTSTLISGTAFTPLTLNGLSAPVTISTTTSLETNSRTLWDVSATATWTEEGSFGTRTDTASLSTVVKD